MQKVKNILFKQPLLSLAALCFAIAIASPFVFVESASHAKQEIVKAAATSTPLRPTDSEGQAAAVQGVNSVINPSATPTSSTATNQPTSQPTATNVPQPTSAPAKQTFQVSLKVNGSSVGNVDMEEGNNQCDVLSRAKDQGKISQLLMKYDNSLGTNGVYQINGIGKDNAVWWVYKVNGASPTQGCSFIKANSGDTVEWEYKG